MKATIVQSDGTTIEVIGSAKNVARTQSKITFGNPIENHENATECALAVTMDALERAIVELRSCNSPMWRELLLALPQGKQDYITATFTDRERLEQQGYEARVDRLAK